MTQPPEAQEVFPLRRIGAGIWRLLCIGISAAALAFVFARVNWHDLVPVMRTTRLALLSLGLVIVVIAIFLQAYRWQICMVNRRQIRYLSLVRATAVSYFFNNFFLSSVGGDIYRAASVFKQIGKTDAVLSLVAVRLTNVWVAALVPAPLLLADSRMLGQRTYRVVFGVSLMAWATLIFLLSVVWALHRGWGANSVNRAPQRMVPTLRTVLAPTNFCFVMGSSAVFAVLTIVVHMFYAAAVGLHVNPLPFAIAVSTVLVLASLPISLNGVGVREIGFVAVLGTLGVPPEKALALCLLSYLGLIILSIVGGVVLLVGLWNARLNS
jgi:uncharacterized membrane protein YbhN (UPF0104 family)